MINLLIGVGTKVFTGLFASIVSEKVAMVVAYRLLTKLAKSTSNTIDDEVVGLIEKSLKEKGYDL